MKQFICKIPGAREIARQLGVVSNPVDSRAFLLQMLPPGSVGAEIGVHEGSFSRQMLSVVRPERLHLIDPWKHEESEEYAQSWYGGKAKGGQAEMDTRYRGVLDRFADEIRSGQVVVHRGDSRAVADSFADGYFDWVYIDGNHLYEFVKRDLEIYEGKTKVGGLIAGDDYQDGGWWQGGVRKAVDEFLHAGRAELVTTRSHQFILRKTG